MSESEKPYNWEFPNAVYEKVSQRFVGEYKTITSYTRGWGSVEVVGTFIASLDNERYLANGQLSGHAETWVPHVFIGRSKSKPGDPGVRGFSVRAARLIARQLLEAADVAEEIEVAMGWHPFLRVRRKPR